MSSQVHWPDVTSPARTSQIFASVGLARLGHINWKAQPDITSPVLWHDLCQLVIMHYE